jgi:simple sugar transport system ATP-binding protein/ribose transport system ATP-binding protein
MLVLSLRSTTVERVRKMTVSSTDMVHSQNAGDTPHVTLRSISKRFGGVQALGDIDLDIRSGTIHALVGQNGAGKSTLGKIIGGLIAPDAGVMTVNDTPVRFHRPRDALAAGITCIAQELALVRTRSVIENVFLGSEATTAGFVANRQLRRRWEELLQHTGFVVAPDTIVGDLRLADQQKVEILRALARDAGLILLDEPTAGLSRPDADLLLNVLRRLRSTGTTIVYVSHFLSEVLSVADNITILKDGRVVATQPAAECEEPGLVAQMLGRELEQAYPNRSTRASSDDSPVLRVDKLTSGTGVRGVSLDVRPGEILGVAGLAGSGRSELLHAIYGADRATGIVEINGQIMKSRSPRYAVAHGLALIPESRKDQGLMLNRSIEENLTLGAVRSKRGAPKEINAKRAARSLFDRLGISASGMTVPACNLSGGNQQKLMFGRCLMQNPDVLLVDEPTRGVDIGAKFAIYELLVELAASGMAIMMVSSEMDEILELSHRVIVMRSGEIAAELKTVETITEHNVMLAAFGTKT